jgi:hypothetical protein
MHRVYNSAFMNMLRDEENANYRSVIKNTLEFDPEVLKRYVNFMNNPDERTAVEQFGKGDKYFGICTLMATLPGLPMFGHGQVEGFTEKYGMEYQRPRYDENADPWMIERHEREIAPLLKRRRLFAESSNFLLYDFFTDNGKVDENVFAYSNRRGDERALVVYNNRYGHTHGTIDYSAAYADKGANQLRQQRIREGLGLTDNSGAVFAWRDSLTGLEYLRRANDLSDRGLTLDLGAYQCHVFLDWRELFSTQEQPWDRLSDQLNGRGVASLDDALVKLELEPAHDALRQLLEPALVRLFADLAEHPRTLAGGVNPALEAERTEFFETAWTRCENFLRQAQRSYLALAGSSAAAPANPGLLRAAFRERLRAAMRIPALEALFPAPWTVAARRMLPSPSPQLTATAMWGPVLAWCVLELLAESIDAENSERLALELFDRLRLREPFAQLFAALGFDGEEAWRVAARVKVGLLIGAGVGNAEAAPAIQAAEELIALKGHDFSRAASASSSTRALAPEGEASTPSPVLWPLLWLDADVRWLCGVHPAEGHDYLVRERYEELLWWLLMPSLLRLAGESAPGRIASNRAEVRAMSKSLNEALATAEAAGYRVDLLLVPAAVEVAAEEPASVPETTPEAAVETAADSEAVSFPESEPIAEATPVPGEQLDSIKEPEPAEPEIEAAVESATELVPESEAAPIPEPEPIAEPTLVPEEQIDSTKEPEPFEPEIEAASVEPAAEHDAASISETEPIAEATAEPTEQLDSTEEPEPAEPEIEAAIVEPAIEPVPESDVASVPEPEPIADATPVPAEQLESTQEAEPAAPEIEPAAAEPAVELEAESIPEPEPIVEATPVPAEQLESTQEAEPAEPETEAAVEPAVELEAESIPEPEPIAEAAPFPAEQLDSTEEPEPNEPEIEAAVEPAADEFVPETEDEPEWSADEPEAAIEEVAEQAEQIEATDQAEAESELPEIHPSGAKNLVDSIASIFARRHAPFAETSILGLREALPSTESWEPATPEDESLPSAEEVPALPEPWEPPPVKIEFTAKSTTEFGVESGTEAVEQPLPTPEPESAETEPSEPEIEQPFEPEAGPDNPLWPPRR